MINFNQYRINPRTLASALVLWAVASHGVQAGGIFSTESDAYEACRWKIESDWAQAGLHRFDEQYGRNRRQSEDQPYVFWINSKVHDLDTGEVQQLRSRCTSAGFGLVTELHTEPGHWDFGG